MSMFEDLLNPETIKGLVLLLIIVFVVTGRASKIIGNTIRKQVDKW